MSMTTTETRDQDRCEIRSVDPAKVALGRTRLLADELCADLADTFGALADSNRVKIVHTLMDQELCVCDLAGVVGISESVVSQHLRILRSLRLVKRRRQGRMMYYSLDDQHVSNLLEVCLEHARDG